MAICGSFSSVRLIFTLEKGRGCVYNAGGSRVSTFGCIGVYVQVVIAHSGEMNFLRLDSESFAATGISLLLDFYKVKFRTWEFYFGLSFWLRFGGSFAVVFLYLK